MMAQVSNRISGLARNQVVLLILGFVIVLMIGEVIFLAAWSARERAGRRPWPCSTVPCGGGAELIAAGHPARITQPCRAGWTPGGATPPVLAEPGTA